MHNTDGAAQAGAVRANTRALSPTQLSLWISVAAIGVAAFWGAWTRRWISDDGLIVLRTVRNLIAGNGPVFNAGERVEANTSTLWQYLIYAGQRITGAKLDYIAMALAIVCSVAAMMVGTLAAGRLHSRSMPSAVAPQNAARSALLLPAGALVYLALPPARDFFTSGLEWGLSIFYLAVLFALLVRWAGHQPAAESQLTPVAGRRARKDPVTGITLAVAFWAGLSWLVRPELALYGGMAGIALFVVHRHWRSWLAILAVALPLPGGYEIFRMGYYGLLTPHTAVAKSAADAAWGKGFAYLGDFAFPYWLWLPVIILIAVGVVVLRSEMRGRRAWAVGVMLGCGFLHLVYVLRVGGDFMHARMLLLPLFAMLLPLFVIPASLPGARGTNSGVTTGTNSDTTTGTNSGVTTGTNHRVNTGVLGLGAAGVLAAWSVAVILHGHPVDWNNFNSDGGVVDEREFWTMATKRERGDAPKTVEDYQDMKLMRGYANGIRGLESGGAFAIRYLEDKEKDTYNWLSLPREAGRDDAPTVFMLNLGMSSMSSPLDVRILDNIGLANPLAARQPRIEGGRIGHDKNLLREWQLADSGVDIEAMPDWIDKEETAKAREALKHEDFQRLFATYRDPLTKERFFANIKWALGEGRSLQFSADPEDYLSK